jgi:hypothetical protein
MKFHVPQLFQKRPQEGFANSFTLKPTLNIDGILRGVTVGAPRLVLMGIGITCQFSALFPDQPGVAGTDGPDTVFDFPGGNSFFLEGDGSIQDIIVVQIADGPGVPWVYRSQHGLPPKLANDTDIIEILQLYFP